MKNPKNNHVSLGDQQAQYLVPTSIITKGENFKMNLQTMQQAYMRNTHKNVQIII